jgi:hypothetical protein
MKLLIKQFSPSSYHFILLSTLFSNTLSLCSSLNIRDQVSHPYRTTGKIRVLYILISLSIDLVDPLVFFVLYILYYTVYGIYIYIYIFTELIKVKKGKAIPVTSCEGP